MSAASNGTIGIVGVGKLARTLAQLSLSAGYAVRVHGSGPVARTARVLETFAPRAQAASWEDVARCDIVVLAIPLSDAEELAGERLSGVVVVDPMNYWEESDGVRPDFTDPAVATSVLVQTWFPRARVVKAFNHVAYKDLAAGARQATDPHRWAIAVASDDHDAAERVSIWVDAVGFEPVNAGGLSSTHVLQPGGVLFGALLSAPALRAALG